MSLLGLFGCLLLVSTVAANSPFVDLVCRSLSIKNPEGKTVIDIRDDGDVTIKGKLIAAQVPLGMMLPYFGNELPEGFVWADGTERWPREESWVPEHLRGQNVPNMDGYLIGGAPTLKQVGLKWESGKIKGVIVTGDSFSLPEPSTHRIQQNAYVFRWAKIAQDNEIPEGIFVGAGRQHGKWEFTEANVPIPTGKLAGTFQIPDTLLNDSETNPRHYLCRWIIRVK